MSGHAAGGGGTHPTTDQRIAALESTLAQSREIAQQQASATEDAHRGWIARTIIWVFVAVVVAVLILLLVQGIMTGNWSAATSQATDLIKSSVVPVVTLVLGYYFGRSGRS
jgi:cytochrome c-type biogenesis protein CcmH/NrfG